MSYDYAGYRHRQSDLHQPVQSFHPYQPPPRRATCWDPPGSRDPQGFPPDDQPSPTYGPAPYVLPQPHRRNPNPYGCPPAPPAQTRRPTCWDPPWVRQTTAYQQPSSYEPDMYSPRRRPTCWDPPTYWETPGQHPFHEDPAYDQPLPPGPNSSWDQPYTDMDSSYAPLRQYTTSTFRQSPYSSDVPPRNPYAEYHQWQHEYKPSRSIPPPLPPSHRRSAAPPPAAAAPPPPLRSDRPPKQQSTTSPIELPPYAAPRPCQPLQPLPVTAPLLASTRRPQAGVSSSRKKEWETTLHDGEEKREEKLIELNRMLNEKEQEKENDSTARREEEVKKNFPKLIEKEIKAEALRSSLETKEKDLSVLPEKPSNNEKMEWQTNLQNADENGLINEVVTCLHDVVWDESIVEDNWKENGIGPKGLVGSKGGEHSDIFKMIKMIILRAFDPGICVRFRKRKCAFLAMQMIKMDLLDNEKELPHEGFIKCLFATETFRIGLNMPTKPVVFANVREFNGDDEVRCTTIRRAFDPGGDTSPKLLLSTLFVASWFPP